MTAEERLRLARRAPAMIGALRARMPLIRMISVFLCSVAGLVLAFAPVLQDGMLASNPDSLFFYVSFDAARHFGTPLDLQTFAFGLGFGGFQNPAILHPFWWIFDHTRSIVLSYYFTIGILFIGVLCYCCALGRNIYFGIVAGTAACTLFFNPRWLADFFGAAAPHCMMQIGLAYLGLAVLMAPGARWLLRTLLGVLLVAWVVTMDWQYAMFIGPFIVISFVTNFIYLDRRRKLQFAVVFLVATVLFYTSGTYDAVNEFSLMSQRLWDPRSLFDDLPTSLLVFGGWPGLPFAKAFGILATLAVAYNIVVWRRRTSVLALLVAAYVATLAIFDWNASGPNVYWTLPVLGYFERPVIPLYAMFLANVAGDVLRLGCRALQRGIVRILPAADRLGQFDAGMAGGAGSIRRLVLPICLSLAIAPMIVIGGSKQSFKRWNSQIRRLPVNWAIAESFARELGLPPAEDRQFSPYFLDATVNGKISNCQHLSTLPLAEFGRYCGDMMSLHFIRAFGEAHNLVDIQNLQMYGQAFELSCFNLNSIPTPCQYGALKSLGIRYVAVDGEVAGGRTLLLGDKKVSLLDLGTVEAADLSVKSVRYDAAYGREEIVAAERGGVAIVHDRAAASELAALSPVESVQFAYGPGSFAISAESSGNSLLLLPFQFSNCLSIAGGSDDTSLVRVNGAQAALRFNTHAAVQVLNNFRMFGDRRCRYRDFADVVRIGILPRMTYDLLTHGRRVPILMRMVLHSLLRQQDAVLAGASGR